MLDRMDVEAELDRLHALSLAGFVEARNALAARLKAAGRSADVARVKAMEKPSAAAWAVNQLKFREPKLLAALLDAGDRLRRKPAERNEAMRERRDALALARRKVEELLASSGQKATTDLLRRVSSTLEAVVAFGRTPGRPDVGRLTAPLDAPGFDEIASLGLLGPAETKGKMLAQAPRLNLVPPIRETKPAPANKIFAKAAPEEPRRPTPAQERALEKKKALAAKRLLDARTREAARARIDLARAEKALEAARDRQQKLETALSLAIRFERKQREEVAAARKKLEAAEAAELAARGPAKPTP